MSVSSTISQPDPDHIWINTFISNTTNASIQAQYIQNRLLPFLQQPDRFNISITRFDMSNSAPIFEWPEDPTVFYVGYRYLGTNYTTQLIQPTSGNVYDVDALTNSINTAFTTSYTALVTAHAGVLTATSFWIFDPVSQLFTLAYDPLAITNGVQIIMSQGLYLKFQSFSINSVTSLPGSDYYFNLFDLTVNRLTPPGSMMQYYTSTQFGAASGSMNDSDSLVITTQFLPVVSEQLSAIGVSSDATINVITDFKIEAPQLLPYGERILYNPTVYRLIPMNGTKPLQRYDFKVWLRAVDGSLSPLLIPPFGHLSIKILFLRVGLFA